MRNTIERIVITGGAGFIGSHLVDYLLAETEAEVVVYDNFSAGQRANLAQHADDPRLCLVAGDVRDREATAAALDDATVVYHLAAQASEGDGEGDGEEIFATNVVGTYNVLRGASHARVRRVVFASSCEVYGQPIDLPVEEGHPLLAVGPYGASKVAGEALCRWFRGTCGLQTAIVRLAHVYGPRGFAQATPRWLDRMLAGLPLGDSADQAVVDLVWVGLVVEALTRAAALEAALPPTNVASGTGTRVSRVTQLVLRAGAVELAEARNACLGVATRFVASVERMRRVLGIDPPLDPLAHWGDVAARPLALPR